MMQQPKGVDYLTDDESDENKGFEVKIPSLDDLIFQFEGGDETIKQATESLNLRNADLKLRGFEKEVREDIKQTRIDKVEMLNANSSTQRAFYEAQLPGMIEDLNAVVRDPTRKLYIR